jgi:protein-tyrosine phosphatase
MKSVLMVCLGNICRSPLAEAALRAAAGREGIELRVDSAGTGDWHAGDPPDPRAQDVALRLGGIDISRYTARQVRKRDFHDFDYVLALDRSNMAHLRVLMPAGSPATLSLLFDYFPGHEGQGVADPYYGDLAGFEACWRQVSAASEAFLKFLPK